MFDWNDEEVTNIIWGKDSKSDDHIVPYPKKGEQKRPGLYGDSLKKEQDEEDEKTTGQKVPVGKTDFSGVKLESSPQHETRGRISAMGRSMDLWPDLSLLDVSKTVQDSFGTEVSNNLTEIAKLDSSKDVILQAHNGLEAFQNQHDDREQGDFLDYGWANIGSFDDLDRIFSNEDSIFGHASLGNDDGLWSSSKAVIVSAEKSFPPSLDSPSSNLGAFRSSSNQFESMHASAGQVEYSGTKSEHMEKELADLALLRKTPALNTQLFTESMTSTEFTGKALVTGQRKTSKSQRKNDERIDRENWQDYYATWSSPGNQFQQFDSQLAPSISQTCGPSILTQQTELAMPPSSQYQHFTNPFMNPSVCGNLQNQYADMEILPQICLQEVDRAVISGYEASPCNLNPLKSMTSDATVKPLTMTPQEKIEKLRWRQQMQALLAIQKQQQQYTNQVSSNDHPKGLPENKVQLIEGGHVEVDNASFDPSSPAEQDDSDTFSAAVDGYCSMEDTILRQLQDIIDKLDIRIRLCIRDSLFRLVQSAQKRHYASNTNSTNGSSRDDALRKEEINTHNRFSQGPDVETETNPIDRTVAHLLFHRPLESSGKHPGAPDSPASANLPYERKRNALMSLPMGSHLDNSKSRQNLSNPGLRSSHLSSEGDQSKNSPRLDASENASNVEPTANGGALEVEAPT